MEKKYKVKIFWGKRQANRIEEMSANEILLEKDNGYDIIDYAFVTEQELQAFIMGVEQSNGWMEYNIIKL